MVRKIFYLGPSMNPLLKRGDTLLVTPVTLEQLQPGEVIVFSNQGRGQIVHRVVAIKADGVITKGDNNPTVDERLIAPPEILGRVTAIERQGRLLPVPHRPPPSLYCLKARHWGGKVWSRFPGAAL
ncbi:MAG: signal peptidase I [Desulfobaccales bacterium]